MSPSRPRRLQVTPISAVTEPGQASFWLAGPLALAAVVRRRRAGVGDPARVP
ncbi:MAG TPA: hypothetical protein VIW70_01085 [Rubrivivax sp.]